MGMNREIIMTEKENELVHWAISGKIQGTPVAPNLPFLVDKYYRVKVYEKLKIGLLAVLSAVFAGFHEFFCLQKPIYYLIFAGYWDWSAPAFYTMVIKQSQC